MINAFKEVNLVTWEPRDRAATWHDSVKRSEEKRRVYLAEGTAYAKIMNVETLAAAETQERPCVWVHTGGR